MTKIYVPVGFGNQYNLSKRFNAETNTYYFQDSYGL